MSSVKQVGLLAAGCQPWNSDVVAASGDRFAYCATLAVYIYQLDRQFNEFKLVSIMSEHKKTITAIAWSPTNPDLFASSGADNQVIIWSVVEQRALARLTSQRGAPVCLAWCLHEKDCVAFVHGRGPLYLWNYLSNNNVVAHKEAQNFMSDVCMFRWHTKKLGKVAFGHMDGSVSLFCPGRKCQKHVLRPENLEGTDEDDPVTALEWDPLSEEYLLVATTHHDMRLVDSEGQAVLMAFQLPSAAAQVHTLAWIGSAPGMFVTGDTHTGVLRIWNVSKSTPIESLRLKKTGFHEMKVFTTNPGSTGEATESHDAGDSPSHTSSTSAATPSGSSSSSQGDHYSLPNAHAVCTFNDGGVGLYDLGHRKWSFLRDLGHVETIFDCKFKPDSVDLLATASFDGTVKVWDVNTLTAVHSSPGNEGVIYSLSWAPSDINCLAASTSRNGAFIWDITKGKVIRRFNEHGKASVFSIAWNHKDSRRIATCGGDGFCVVRQVDGKLVMRYKHPGPAYGCDWSPHNKDMLATGCEDKNVRVYYLATNSDQPLKVFSGHTAKVFHVRWSPLREGFLCSGSDDCTVRIWDYTQECCTHVLQGHSGPVRGLLWNPEIPYLLISGSWDYTVRIWDTRDGACLDTVFDHGADVYGLTCHPDRPFLLASCSRDSTVRLWSLTPLVQPLELNILANRPWDDIINSPEHAFVLGVPPLLTGKVSRDLKLQLEKGQSGGGDIRARTVRWFSRFFASPGGASNLWELASVCNNMDDNLLSDSYRRGIMHMKHLTKFRAAKAQELEMVKVSKFGAGLGAPSREERLREAASIHIRLGNTQRYCELLVELGEWEKALSVAPNVSMAYWKSLAERRAQYLIQQGSDDTIPFCVATGNVGKLVQFFTSRGQLQDAVQTAVAAYEGTISVPTVTKPVKAVANGVESDAEENLSLLRKTTERLADWHFHNGAACLAACCHLTVDDCQRAMSKLIRGHELELAASVGIVLGSKVAELTYLATEYLARRCERIGRWELGVDLLKTTLNADLALARLCARCAASMAEINDLHTKAGLPSMDACLEEAAKQEGQSHVFEAIKLYLLSTEPEQGLRLGLQEVKARMSEPQWTVNSVWDYLQLMGCIQTEKLQQHKCAKSRSELMVLSAYVGSLVAVRRNYHSIVVPLLQHALQILQRDKCEVALSESQITSESAAWRARQAVIYNNPSRPGESRVSMPVEQQDLCERMIQRAGKETSPVEVGPDMVSGSHLPSHSDVHHSCLDGRRIQGPSYFLEDGRSAISISDAMMWAKVNPFSPLGSGVRINPF